MHFPPLLALVSTKLNTRLFGIRRVRQVTKDIFEKSYEARLPDLERAALENEIEVLQMLQKNYANTLKTHVRVTIPQIIQIHRSPTCIGIKTKLFDGKRIEFATKEFQKDALLKSLDFIDQIQTDVGIKQAHIKKISSLGLYFHAPMLLVIAILRNPRRMGQFFALAVGFARLYLPRLFSPPSLTLAHGDLDPHNIMYNRTQYLIADWENARYTDPLTDLASIPQLWMALMPLSELYAFCLSRLRSAQDENIFKALVLYGALSTMAHGNRDEHNYHDALHLIDFLDSTRKTPYEHLSGVVFDLLARLGSRVPVLTKPAVGGAILCYHNLGSDSWRFSTPAWELEQHIAYLKKNHSIMSLSEVISRGEGVALTFDDGYASVATIGLPLCEKYGITATVFVLGDPEHANRMALDNDNPLLSDEQIQLLLDHGWDIGYHTTTHLDLQMASVAQLESEIVDGKSSSETRLGIKHRYFAYPKGAHSTTIIELVRRAGFVGAFIVDGTSALNHNDPFRYDRISIERGYDERRLSVLLSPVGMQFTSLFSKLLQWKERVIQSV